MSSHCAIEDIFGDILTSLMLMSPIKTRYITNFATFFASWYSMLRYRVRTGLIGVSILHKDSMQTLGTIHILVLRALSYQLIRFYILTHAYFPGFWRWLNHIWTNWRRCVRPTSALNCWLLMLCHLLTSNNLFKACDVELSLERDLRIDLVPIKILLFSPTIDVCIS